MATPVLQIHRLELAPSTRDAGGGRLLYLDNLKIVLVVGVIVAHALTHYVSGGAWLNHRESVAQTLVALVGLLGFIGELFWVGLLLLIAGFLAPGSLARRGAWRFVWDRLLRLGVPFILFAVLIMPLLHYAEYVATSSGAHHLESPWPYLAYRVRDLDPGPLWFVADLLLFSTVYAVWRRFRPDQKTPPSPLRTHWIMTLALAIALASFAVHLIFPLSTRQYLDLHLAQWPQYIGLFWLGTVSAQRGWLVSLPDRLWRQCGLTVIVSAAAVLVVGVTGGAVTGQPDAIIGGWHWQALAIAGIEGAISVAGALWTLEYFRRHLNRQGRAAAQLARSAYGAYVVHQIVLVGLALALLPLALPIEANFVLLAPATVGLSFATAWLVVVRLGVARRIL